MKYKNLLAVVLLALIVFTAFPVCAAAEQTDTVTTKVTLRAESVYTFTLPPNGSLNYPDTEVVIGQFGVGELLMGSGESLTVELIPGNLAARDGSGLTLPYTVVFKPPAALDGSESGNAYDVTVKIDKDDFKQAEGEYSAPLLFRVKSYPSGRSIWEGTVYFTAFKNPEPKTGSLKIKKVDETTQKGLSGAVFSVYKNKTLNNLVYSGIQTDGNGEAQITEMAPGDYWLVETAAPAGYTLSSAAIEINITAGQLTTVIIPNTAEQEFITGNLKITKVDSATNKALKGAVFDIYNDAALKDRAYQGLKTDSKGVIVVEGMDPGDYWLVEVTAPSGYKRFTGKIKATIVESQTTNITIQNTKTKEHDYQTGTDDYNLILLAGFMMLTGVAFIIWSRRKVRE